MQNNKKKILFVIASLAGGGAERVMTYLLRYMDTSRYDLHLVLFNKTGRYLRDVPDYVVVHDLHKKGKLSFLNLIFRLRKIILLLRPSVIVSFIDYANVVALLARLASLTDVPIIISERNYLSLNLAYTGAATIRRLLYMFLYRFADLVLVNSKASRKDIISYLSLDPNKVDVLYNPIDVERVGVLSGDTFSPPIAGAYILSVGRLKISKGHRFLIEAFSTIAGHIAHSLVILGEGSECDNLQAYAQELGVGERVIFAGFKENPYPYMKSADLFVLSSLYEGFPNVLLEAMICGAPVVSTDCLSGPAELVSDGDDGVLVPVKDTKILAEKILDLLTNENKRKLFARNALKKVRMFDVHQVVPQFEKLLTRIGYDKR